MRKYDGKTKKKKEKVEKKEHEPVAKRVGREVVGLLETITPRAFRGITILVVAIPTTMIILSTMSSIMPHISHAVNLMAPIIVSMVPALIALTILSLFIGVVKRLV